MLFFLCFVLFLFPSTNSLDGKVSRDFAIDETSADLSKYDERDDAEFSALALKCAPNGSTVFYHSERGWTVVNESVLADDNLPGCTPCSRCKPEEECLPCLPRRLGTTCAPCRQTNKWPPGKPVPELKSRFFGWLFGGRRRRRKKKESTFKATFQIHYNNPPEPKTPAPKPPPPTLPPCNEITSPGLSKVSECAPLLPTVKDPLCRICSSEPTKLPSDSGCSNILQEVCKCPVLS